MKFKKKKRKSSSRELPGNGMPGQQEMGVQEGQPDGAWEDHIEAVRRSFPGPAQVSLSVPLRIAMAKRAFAQVTAHVLESLEKEICGVMVGEVCKDEEGFFVQVHHSIRGQATEEGTAHVTFTQDTWNAIHHQLENDYPGLMIVGWYHSHPGFGVLFSEMDLFIQRNFFPSPTQFALVMDPLGGEKAICVNTDDDIRYVEKFWVDGREIRASRPPLSLSSAGSQSQPGAVQPGDGSNNLDIGRLEEKMDQVETRLSQVLQVLQRQEANISRPLMIMAVLVFLLIVLIGYRFFFQGTLDRSLDMRLLPKLMQYVPVKIKIGNTETRLGVGAVEWDIKPALPSTHRPFMPGFFQGLVEILGDDSLRHWNLENRLGVFLDNLERQLRPLLLIWSGQWRLFPGKEDVYIIHTPNSRYMRIGVKKKAGEKQEKERE